MRPPFFGPDAWKPLAEGWLAFERGEVGATLLVHADDGETETLPISLFFRTGEELRAADEEALARATGRVLDVGAGVGALALVLQERGFRVTALEVVPEGVEMMRRRGVIDVVHGRLEELADGGAYDTVLLLMNGTALAGTLAGFPGLLASLEPLLAPGGQVLVDSTDLTGGMGSGPGSGSAEGTDRGPADGYPGEIQYQMEFRGIRGAPFPQLFLDPGLLVRVAEENGWGASVVWTAEAEYLARLTRPVG